MMKKILIAEDNKLMLETINHKLKKDGYEVIKTADGRECLDFLEGNEVDLLITDLYMPYVNGLEVIDTIRTTWKRTLPILVLTSDSAEDTVLQAFELGADDYMVKPFSISELSVRLKRLIRP